MIFQRTLEKDFVNTKGVFLPEEISALGYVTEFLCGTLPNADNPFCFGIATRRLVDLNGDPNLEQTWQHVKLASPPQGRPDFYLEECQRTLQMAARPMTYLAGVSNLQDYCEPNENALKDGVIFHSDRMAFTSLNEGEGWFLLGLEFSCLQGLLDNSFAATFLTGIAETIFAMDQQNEKLRRATIALEENCRNRSVNPPSKQVYDLLDETGFLSFARDRYMRSGPRNFFGG